MQLELIPVAYDFPKYVKPSQKKYLLGWLKCGYSIHSIKKESYGAIIATRKAMTHWASGNNTHYLNIYVTERVNKYGTPQLIEGLETKSFFLNGDTDQAQTSHRWL